VLRETWRLGHPVEKIWEESSMPAVLFGSISSVADTSELQRDAFNRAFEIHGLGWRWDRDEYRAMLDTSGGTDRVAEYARSVAQTADAQAIHDTKSKLFQQSLTAAQLRPRPGVVDTIMAARSRGWKVGLVTTTSHANIVALLDSLAPDVQADHFDVVVDADSVAQPKPEPDAYAFALNSLSEQPSECVAIEDNLGGVRAALAAGVPCVAFPNENTAGHDFGDTHVVERLDFDDLTSASDSK
jgi:HAD superfamily hydrolase (TIGR01509 family)